jgi:anti-sigma factor RsiW
MAEPLRAYEHGYTCIEVVELATDFVEGTLSPEEATLFELHLNFCDGCMTFVDQIRETAELTRPATEEQVPEELKAKLMTAFRDWKRA